MQISMARLGFAGIGLRQSELIKSAQKTAGPASGSSQSTTEFHWRELTLSFERILARIAVSVGELSIFRHGPSVAAVRDDMIHRAVIKR